MLHWSRRQFLLSASAGVATLALGPGRAAAEYTLPKLPYAYDALEPSIDAKTMKIHHDLHHAAYIANANKILAKHPKLAALPVEELLAKIKKLELPAAERTGLINNAGGHSNHSIFWEIMGPKGGGEPSGALAKAIDKAFGSFSKFQDKLSTAAATQFGSGWAWLVVGEGGKLEVVQEPNQNSPYMTGLKPLLGIDVWEHAYYLKYQNRRPEYIKAWWNVVNWKAVAERYEKYHKG